MIIHKPSSLGKTEVAVRDRVKMLLDEEVVAHRLAQKPLRGPIKLKLITLAVRGAFRRRLPK